MREASCCQAETRLNQLIDLSGASLVPIRLSFTASSTGYFESLYKHGLPEFC